MVYYIEPSIGQAIVVQIIGAQAMLAHVCLGPSHVGQDVVRPLLAKMWIVASPPVFGPVANFTLPDERRRWRLKRRLRW